MTTKGWILMTFTVGAALIVASSAAAGFSVTGPGDALTILGGGFIVICVLMAIYWKEGLGQDRTRMPRIRASGSLYRHALRKEHLSMNFRAWVVSPEGTLPPPPKPGIHDEAFLSRWEAGDLPGCQERLNELVEEIRDPGSPSFSRSLFYHRWLERAEKGAMSNYPLHGSEASIFDETD